MRPASPNHETSNRDASIVRSPDRQRNEQHPHAQESVAWQDFAIESSSDDASSDGFLKDEDGNQSHKQQGKDRPNRPSILSRPSSIGRRTSFIDRDEAPPTTATTPSTPSKSAPVRWRDLPNKRQLAILTMARLSEPLTQTSLQAYMFYQLESFDPSLPPATISAQAGMLQGSFTAAQFVTAVLWGRLADNERVGRKTVLLIGLMGTCISCVGFGFSRTFWQAAVFRTMGGALNGNVGVMRTMISEIVREKKFQSRAFLLLPMCFNIGVIIGPVLGGLLSDPVGSYPRVFGEGSLLGGKDGVWWLTHWPYALPNLLSAVFLFSSATAVLFGLEEVFSFPKSQHLLNNDILQTLDALHNKTDFGIRLRHSIARLFRTRQHHYTAISTTDVTLYTPSTTGSRPFSYELESRLPRPTPKQPKPKLPFHRIWTRNVFITFLCHFLLAMHVGTFNSLWFIHLSTPRFNPSLPSPPTHTKQSLPFNFTGGLGMPPRSVGFAMAVLGVIGISLQLLVYPRINSRLGTVRSFRYALLIFPIAYTLAPYLSLIPSTTPPPSQASGPWIWLALSAVLFIQVVARTFALPATIILINNCSPHPSVLGTIHGVAQSVSSFARTVGPVMGGWVYGRGLQAGVVGGAWWGLAGSAVVGAVVAGGVREGDGHEILLEGEEGGK